MTLSGFSEKITFKECKKMEKFDCFAYGTLANGSKGCAVLTDCVCSSGECPFYKTKAQIKEEKSVPKLE